MHMNNEDDFFKKSFNYCIYLLSRKDYSEKQLIDKLLSKGYESISTINKLKEYKYLDDSKYIKRVIQNYSQKEGPLKLLQRLRNYGFNQSLINENKELLLLIKANPNILEKKFKIYKQEDEVKYWRFLASKGYNSSQCKQTINEFKENLSNEHYD